MNAEKAFTCEICVGLGGLFGQNKPFSSLYIRLTTLHSHSQWFFVCFTQLHLKTHVKDLITEAVTTGQDRTGQHRTGRSLPRMISVLTRCVQPFATFLTTFLCRQET